MDEYKVSNSICQVCLLKMHILLHFQYVFLYLCKIFYVLVKSNACGIEDVQMSIEYKMFQEFKYQFQPSFMVLLFHICQFMLHSLYIQMDTYMQTPIPGDSK